MDYGAIGICVAKVSEAEILINNSIDNILITSPVVTLNKLNILASCLSKQPNTMIVVDNYKNLEDLDALGAKLELGIRVLIDLDPGIGRTGINNTDAINFAKYISKYKWLSFEGIQCYAGNLQHIQSYSERKEQSLSIMKSASGVANQLKSNGFNCKILTGTGTGTFDIDCNDTLVTEIQPGSYTVMDVEYNKIESNNNKNFTICSNSMTLLTTVISNNNHNHATVDAGTKAIYIDQNKPDIISHEGLHYDWNGFGDEHGKITADNNVNLPSYSDVLELIGPHCDPTINLYDYFYIVEDGIVIDVWEIDMRGKSQ